jgi:hypothetical protein
MSTINTGSFLDSKKYKCENFKLKTESFIETGSYLGDGIQLAINSGFKNIFSIELHQGHYEHCVKRFLDKHFVRLFLGDSTIVLPKILKEYPDTNFTYWLDGHYSGPHTALGNKETPLLEELECILSRQIKNELVYIDDMRIYRNLNNNINETNIFKLIKKLKPNAEVYYKESAFDKEDILVIEY